MKQFPLLMTVLLILAATSAALSITPQHADVGSTITIHTEGSVGTLRLNTPLNQSFVLIPSNGTAHYQPRQPGVYTLTLDGVSAYFTIADNAQPSIRLDSNTYVLNDEIHITIDNYEPRQEILITTPDSQYRYLGIPAGLTFIPRSIGEYTIEVWDEHLFARTTFTVYDRVVTTPRASITLHKNHYIIGELINFTIHAPPSSQLVIQAGDTLYTYPAQSNAVFTPSKAGQYSARVQEGGTILAEQGFSVGLNETPQESAQRIFSIANENVVQELAVRLTKKDNIPLTHDYIIYEQGAIVRNLQTDRPYDVVIRPRGHNVKDIVLENVKVHNKALDITLDTLHPQTINIPKDVFTAYFVDTTSLDADRVTLRAQAVGSELYRCSMWNLTNERCETEWVKDQSVIPGELYEVAVTGTSAYAETGVASVNTQRATYHPGDVVNITMVVLDTAGYLVNNANVTLTITTPLGDVHTYNSDEQQIFETSRGIYEMYYDNATDIGTYLLDINAIGYDVNSSMRSHFTVEDYFEFDVLRDIPVTIDPWLGPYNASITVTSLTNASVFSVTEKLPAQFSVVSSLHGIVTQTSDGVYITWPTAENNSVLTYQAQVPLVTPDLYALGPVSVQYGLETYEEARPWYLAIDPVQSVSDCRQMTDSVHNGDTSVDWSGTLNDFCIDNDGTDDSTDELSAQADGDAYIRDLASGDEVFIETNNSVANLDCQSVTSFNVCFRLIGDSATDECWVHASNGSSADLPNTPVLWEELYFSGVNLCDSATVSQCISSTTVDTCDEVANAHVRLTTQRHEGGQLNKGTIEFDYVITNYTVVSQPPTVALNTPQDNTLTGQSTIDFTFTPSDQTGISGCNLVINGAASTQNTTAILNNQQNTIQSTLSDGTHTWSVNCTDVGGSNYTNNTPYTLSIDTTPPTTFNLLNPANNTVSNVSTPLLQWQETTEGNFDNYTIIRSSDLVFGNAGDTFYKIVGPTSNTSFQVPSAWSGNQPHHWIVIAYDVVGNSRESGWFNYTLDSISPSSLSLSTPASGTVSQNRSPTLSWSASSDQNFANYTMEFSIANDFSSVSNTFYTYNLASNTTYPIPVANQLADNTLFYWRVQATDLAGHKSQSNVFTYTTDSIKPAVDLFLPENVSYQTSLLTLNYSATDPNRDACVYSLDGGSNITLTNCVNTTFSTSEGGHSLILYANDSAGNTNDTSINFTIDLTDPSVLLISPGDESFVTTTVTSFSFTPTDTALHSCVLYGNWSGIWAANATNDSVTSGIVNYFSPLTLLENHYRYNVYCNDTSGRSAFSSTNFTFVVDYTPPEVNLSQPFNNTLNDTSNNIIFTYNVSESMSSLSSCELIVNSSVKQTDNAPEQGMNTFTAFINNGLYNWSVNCTDSNGFEGASLDFNLSVNVIDADPPLITLNAPVSNNFTTATSIIFNYTPQDASGIDNCQLRINDQINKTCDALCGVVNFQTNNFTVENFNDGFYQWNISCTDTSVDSLIGNSSTRNFTIDTILPTLELLHPIDTLYNSTLNIPLNYSRYDTNLHTCFYSLNYGSNITIDNCANITFNTTLGGRNNLTLHVNDSAGNLVSAMTAFNASINASLSLNYTPTDPLILKNVTLHANYTDEYGQGIQDAYCTTPVVQRYVENVGSLSDVQSSGAPSIYNQNVLRVDISPIPSVSENYTAFVRAQRSGTNDSLRVYLSCDGTHHFGQSRLIGSILPEYGIVAPYFGLYQLSFSSSFVTSSSCSILFESNQSATEGWIVGDVDTTLNQGSSYFSQNMGGSFAQRDNNVSHVDIGYAAQYPAFSYDTAHAVYNLTHVYYSSIGQFDQTIVCSTNFSAGRELSIPVSITDNSAPLVQITYLTPNPARFNIENVTLMWTANDEQLNGSVIRIYYPNGTLLFNSSVNRLELNASMFPVAGLYALNAQGNDTAENSVNATDTLTIQDSAPTHFNTAHSPTTPQTYSPTQLYVFNTTWEDENHNIHSVVIEHNISGIIRNYSVVRDGNVYTYNITLPAGNHGWRYFANDTSGNVNVTPLQTFHVDKAASTINLTINGSANNEQTTEGARVNFSVYSLIPPNGSVLLLRNGTQIASGNSPLLNISNVSTPGYYNYTAVFVENQNYTSTFQNFSLNVLDTQQPRVNLEAPLNLTIDNDGDMIFQYNVSDTSFVGSCNLIMNGSVIDTDDSIQKGVTQSFSTTRPNGDHLWSVNCTDASGLRGQSEERIVTAEIVIVKLHIVPISCDDSTSCDATLINTTTVDFDDHGTAERGDNFVYVNFTPVTIKPGSNITNVSVSYDKSQGLSTGQGTFFLHWINTSGIHLICSAGYVSGYNGVNCTFPQPFPTIQEFSSGFQLRANFERTVQGGSPSYQTHLVNLSVTYVEDVTPPNIELIDPEDQIKLGQGNTFFNYTASDAAGLANCTLYGNFSGSWQANETNTSVVSDAVDDMGPVFLDVGFYQWNVQCYDLAGNAGFANDNRTLNVTRPDLTIKSENIIFLNTSVLEGENVTVNATIQNIGLTDANGFIVEFYNGSVSDQNRVYNLTIEGLTAQTNVTVNATITMQIGPNVVSVRVDGNNSVLEATETNNEANNTLNVSSYSFYVGNLSAINALSTFNNATLKQWDNPNTTANIYVLDKDSDVDFFSLQALGRTTTGGSSNSDFEEADRVLNMTAHPDSLSVIYTSDGSTPHTTESMTLFGNALNTIAVTNSTNNTLFVTGILWDSSKDTSLNDEYDDNDKEPLVFVTQLRSPTEGAYGTYAFELRVPTRLRTYEEADSDQTLLFYVELT